MKALYPESFSDFQLIKLLQQQDTNAFSFIYDTYAPALFGTILKIVKDDKLASDILEKSFLTIWKESTKLDHTKQSLFAWMYSITYKMAKAQLLKVPSAQNTSVALDFSSTLPA
jgi:RNA polymerase sigma-70 factor (ECF subfamily)